VGEGQEAVQSGEEKADKKCAGADTTVVLAAGHSHVAVRPTSTADTNPAVVAGVTTTAVVPPSRVVTPVAAVGGDVQLHECSPLVSSSRGHDTAGDAPSPHVVRRVQRSQNRTKSERLHRT
jgi:hypothetical protein